MLGSSCLIGSVLILLSLSSVASAQDIPLFESLVRRPPSEAVLVLNAGSELRGRLNGMRFREFADIVTEDGTSHHQPWSTIEQVLLPLPPPKGRHLALLADSTQYCGVLSETEGEAGLVLQLVTTEKRTLSQPKLLALIPVEPGASVESGSLRSTERLVLTKGGAVYRGNLVEYVPQRYVLLHLATGELRYFAWGIVADVQPLDRPTPADAPADAKASRGMAIKIFYRQTEYSGEIMAYVPDEYLLIRDHQGDLRQFPWDDVRVSEQAPLPTPRPVNPLEFSPVSRTFVRIEPERTDLTLFRAPALQEQREERNMAVERVYSEPEDRIPFSISFGGFNVAAIASTISAISRLSRVSKIPEIETKEVCNSPCRSWIYHQNFSDRYRIGGKNVPVSDFFDLPVRPDEETIIKVRPGRFPISRRGGIAMIVLGSVALHLGIVATSFFGLTSSSSPDQLGLKVGIGLLSGGVLSVVGGGLFIRRVPTKVELEGRSPTTQQLRGLLGENPGRAVP